MILLLHSVIRISAKFRNSQGNTELMIAYFGQLYEDPSTQHKAPPKSYDAGDARGFFTEKLILRDDASTPHKIPKAWAICRAICRVMLMKLGYLTCSPPQCSPETPKCSETMIPS